MSYTVLIPARMQSARLPNKPLADLGGKPMIVRVAEAASRTRASLVAVASDSADVIEAVEAAGYCGVLTANDHETGTDRLAEAVEILQLEDDHIVVNLQGDEPLMPPEICDAVADALADRSEQSLTTAAHTIHDPADFANPNIVKVIVRQDQQAMYFSRAPIPWARDGDTGWPGAAEMICAPLRHIGIYAYRAGFLRQFPKLTPAPLEQLESLEQLRALWHGFSIGVVTLDSAPPGGVDTPADLARVRDHILRSS